MSIAENIARIRENMNAAAIAAGRDPKEILLCAATKMNDTPAVREAILSGVDLCGENRVQELTKKLADNAYEGISNSSEGSSSVLSSPPTSLFPVSPPGV